MALMKHRQVTLEAATAAVTTSAALRRAPTASEVDLLRVPGRRRHIAEAAGKEPLGFR